MSKEREILKSGIWYTIGNILVKAISFVALPIFTNIMTTEEYGVFGTYQAFETILSVVISLGISGTVRPAFNDFRDNFERYVSSITFPLFCTSTIGLIIVGIYTVISKNYYLGFLGIALVLNCLGNALREIFSSRFVILNKYKENLAMSFAMSILNIGISYGLCMTYFNNHRDFGRIWGTVLASCIVAAVLFVIQLHNDHKIFWPRAWKFAIVVGMPLILHQLSISILGQCDKIMIQNMVGSAEAGIYASMTTIILVPQAIMSSIESAWTPWFYNIAPRDQEKNIQHEIQRFNTKLIWLFAIIIIGFQLLSHEVVTIMVSSEYRSGVYILYILSISVFENFLYIFAVNVEYFRKKTAAISLYTLIASVINIGLNYLFICLLGYLGAAVATVCSRIILLLLHSYQAKKISGFYSVPLKTLIVSNVIVIASALICVVLNNYVFVRMVMTAVVTVIGLYYLYTKFYKIKT